MHSRWAQFFVGLVLLVAVVLPFYGFALVGNPPSHEFSADSTALTVYEAVGRVKPRQTVLFAIEYGPTAAGELDPSLKATLRHTLSSRWLADIDWQQPNRHESDGSRLCGDRKRCRF
jgi:hypothetical protein